MIRRALIATLAVLFVSPIASADDNAKKSKYTKIFDGKSLKGWDGNPKFWSVRDGAITGQTTKENPTKGNTFIIWKDGQLKNFDLKLKWRIVGGNSGIQYRSRVVNKKNWVVGGYQADIEAGTRYIGILYEERGRGILAMRSTKVVIDNKGKKKVVGKTVASKKILASIKKEKWNTYQITAKGNHLVQKINGHTTVDVTDNHKARRAMSGILALQLHAGPPMLVQFKDIMLKTLK